MPSLVLRDVCRPPNRTNINARTTPAITSDFVPRNRLRNSTIEPDHGPEEPASRMGQGQGMAEERQRGQPEDARQAAAPIEQAVEAEDHRAVEDLADVVGVAEIPGARRASRTSPVRSVMTKRRNADIAMKIQHGQEDRDQDNADEATEEELEAARGIDVRQHEQVEDEDLHELDGEIEPDLELPVHEIRDEGDQQDPDPEHEDRTLPHTRRGQLGDEFVPRQDDARDDRDEIKRYLLQPRDEIRGPDEQDRGDQMKRTKSTEAFP